MNRRNLSRSLAVAVALTALSSLVFAAGESNQGQRGQNQGQQAR
jgi:hypothetical protein